MKRAGVLSSFLVAILTTGCFVEVRHVDDPRPAFDRARAEAAQVAGRPGRAQQVNVLVYERDEQQLVKVSLPMWIAQPSGVAPKRRSRGSICAPRAISSRTAAAPPNPAA